MKKNSHLYYIVFLMIFSNALIAQSSNRVNKVDHSNQNNIIEYSIPVANDGSYSVALLSPSGEVLSWPIKDQKKSTGTRIDFSINSKYWESGDYRLQLIVDNKTIDVYIISVGLSAREKARLKERDN